MQYHVLCCAIVSAVMTWQVGDLWVKGGCFVGCLPVVHLIPKDGREEDSFVVKVKQKDQRIRTLLFEYKKSRNGYAFQSSEGHCEIGFGGAKNFQHMSLDEVRQVRGFRYVA